MKLKMIILLVVLMIFNLFSLDAKLKWRIIEKTRVDYSQRYPRELLKFILWRLENEAGQQYSGISVDKRKFLELKEGDEVYVVWDQYPDIPRDLLHTVYTLYPKYFDDNFEKALIIIGDVNHVKENR